MALVNDNKKFIFFHIFKCAGNSMRHVLHDSKSDREIGGGHSITRDIKLMMTNSGSLDQFNSYFKFTVVKNPFDWMASTYNYIRAYKIHRYHDPVINMTLAEFIQFYVDVMMLNEGVPIGSNKCVTLFDFISDEDGKVLVDFIGRVENIDQDMKTIYSKIGMQNIALPRLNVDPKRALDYRTVYTPEARALVEKHFEKDLNYFNYQF